MNKVKSIAILIVSLFCLAIFTTACGGGSDHDLSYIYVPVPGATETIAPTPEPTPTVNPTPDPTPTVDPTPDPTPTIDPTPDPTVSPTPDPTPEKYALELSNVKFTLDVGATDNVTVTLNGEDVTDSVTYTVDEEAIATVEGGLITGVSAGVAIVKVHSDDAQSDEIFVVNVIDPILPNLEVEPSEITVGVGGEGTVEVTLEGETVTDSVNYKVAEEDVATVEGGTISGLSEGNTTVIVSLDGANSAVFTVEVISNPFVDAEEGDTVTMGSYFYTAEGEVQPIEWQVLHKDTDNNRLLVVSKYVLDGHNIDPYSDSYSSYSWANSGICKWLNSYFYNTAFNDAEKSFIYSTTLEDVDPDGGTYNVFLLSGNTSNNGEIYTYFTSNEARKCEATPYAADRCYCKGYPYYWLRTKQSNKQVCYVNDTGAVYRDNVFFSFFGVRPALWINL